MAAVAEGQGGVISRAELEDCGASGSTISRWVAAGRLHRHHPGVYSVGHRAVALRGRLIAALRYGGPEAALSHQTAAWCWGLIEAEPRRVHVSIPGWRRSLRGVRIHERRPVEAVERHALPVTTVPRTLFDLAVTLRFDDLRRALAEADHLGLLVPSDLESLLGRGRPGSAALRRALAAHLPQLAETLSVLEERFLILIDEAGLPMPEVNARIEGLKVDCLWRDARLVVELDGHQSHSAPAARERDHERDRILRRAGLRSFRYTWQQVVCQTADLTAELHEALEGNREALDRKVAA